MACAMPWDMSFADASIFPLGFTTAAHAFFNSTALALAGPTVHFVTGSAAKRVFIWGWCVFCWGEYDSVGSRGGIGSSHDGVGEEL